MNSQRSKDQVYVKLFIVVGFDTVVGVGGQESNSRRGGDYNREQELLSAMVLMVWMTNLCLWLTMTTNEIIKNLDPELLQFLQVLHRNVKNLNAKKRFLSNIFENLQFTIKK